MSKEVSVADFSCWSTSISFLFGKTPKVNMICGECYYSFSQRFSPIDFRNGNPRALCPSCNTINRVPLTVG